MAVFDPRAEAWPPLPHPGATAHAPRSRRPDHAGAARPGTGASAWPRLERRRALRSPGIRAAYGQLRAASPQARRCDIALALNLTEGELVAAHAGLFHPALSSLTARHLLPQWRRIVAALPALGMVRTVTGNRWCQLERTGEAQALVRRCTAEEPAASACGCLANAAAAGAWAHGFAVEERGADGRIERSLQFFDPYGQAVAQVLLVEGSRVDAFFDIVETFSSYQLAPGLVIPVKKPACAPRREALADGAAGVGAAWCALCPPQELETLRARCGLARPGAEPAGHRFATRLPNASAHQLLAAAAQTGVGLTLNVDSRAGRQSRYGQLRDVRLDGAWLHARGPEHGLCLREDAIAQTWLLRRPSRQGLQHALVLLDAAGEAIASFTGEPIPGGAERCEWRRLMGLLAAEA